MPRWGRVQATIDAGKARREMERERRAAMGHVPTQAENEAAMARVAKMEADSAKARAQFLQSTKKSAGGGKRPSGLAPGKSNEQVIAEAKARIASRPPNHPDNDWDRRLIGGTIDRMSLEHPDPAKIAAARVEKATAAVAEHKAALDAHHAQPRTKLENQIQKALAKPATNLPADPFQGFHGEHPATNSLLRGLHTAEETAQIRATELPRGLHTPTQTLVIRKLEATPPAGINMRDEQGREFGSSGLNPARKAMSDKQKESLAKAHAAVRAKAEAKKAALRGVMGGGAVHGVGGGAHGDQPRVPAGSPAGGEFTFKK